MNSSQNADSTKEKIKKTAQKLFAEKGYAATKTREIATESGINLALMNYHFGSKEKLFHLIMEEILQQFVPSLGIILNDKKTTFNAKIQALVNSYIDMLRANPEMPLFILSEMRSNHLNFISRLNPKEIIMNSHFLVQFQEGISTGKIAPIHPLHFMMNLIGMIVFPFVGSPILRNIGGLEREAFDQFMEERKALIPMWINKIIKPA